jgi:hypothetical protein
MFHPPSSTKSIAKNRKSLSLPNPEISAFPASLPASQPASQPNRVYKRILYLQKCAKNNAIQRNGFKSRKIYRLSIWSNLDFFFIFYKNCLVSMSVQTPIFFFLELKNPHTKVFF